jgi:hypothetical protein
MASLGSFDIGDKPVVTATFADITGGVNTATAVTFIVRDPAGTQTSYATGHASVANPSTNVWRLTMPTLTIPQRWVVNVKATAALVAAAEATLNVRQTEITTP